MSDKDIIAAFSKILVKQDEQIELIREINKTLENGIVAVQQFNLSLNQQILALEHLNKQQSIN